LVEERLMQAPAQLVPVVHRREQRAVGGYAVDKLTTASADLIVIVKHFLIRQRAAAFLEPRR
jgi:hypothetical protein